MTACGADNAAMPALPALLLPERDAATIAPPPRIMAMIEAVVARPQFLAQARQMAAGNVAGLVGEHADHLVRRLRLHQRAGIDEDAPAVGDEGVEGAAVDDHDLDVLLRQPGRLQERLGVVAQQLLDLRVPHDRGAAAAAAACAGVAAASQWLAAIASETATAHRT